MGSQGFHQGGDVRNEEFFVAAETPTTVHPADSAGIGTAAGGASMTAWTLMPLRPKALTPARRCVPRSARGANAVQTRTGEWAKSRPRDWRFENAVGAAPIVLQAKDGPEQREGPRSAIEVAIISLPRSDCGKAGFLGLTGKGEADPLNFNRVPQVGPGTVGFDVGKGGKRHPCRRQRS